jgi:hypothetical protein
MVAHALRVAAREFGVTPARAAAVAGDACDRLAAALDDTMHTVAVLAGEHRILGDLHRVLRASVRDTRERLLASGTDGR